MKKELKVIKKKKHIIEALKRCLEQDVYSQVSLEDVAKEAGFSKGGLRHYFPTREELYVALIENFFNQIQRDQIGVVQGLDLDKNDKALITTLFGIEKFLLDKKNMRILINIILYGFEDEKIRDIIKKFIRNHLNLYATTIRDLKSGVEVAESEAQFIGRITQVILLFAGILEYIDPINVDTPKLIEFILTLFKHD
ncbi:MAG TPA: TetR/AcrR family transcriptional regulator [Spirochaetota bacterium]|nr:TetR/AcrR family transcriptional regulator [Spirochaetota bacterium]HPC41579.1 TetR/AcrR family transcriptional regulator [Spirochaetota bacterium]HQF08311.1 TetR/AcrR family transcriptional regulator [Spirochaetota bacterium]HQH97074.1 TetR/AcrR family transcriptional regulator [Spirochaetota bacterium]HQJ69985.1 TetR/AcrR family transcriptional regulator [Spirochaetota bacterium]